MTYGRRHAPAYDHDAVVHAETHTQDVIDTLAARVGSIPRHGPYTWEATIGTRALTARGWTPDLITQLLGRPDLVRPTANGLHSPSFGYGLDRVEHAEATDPDLQRRRAATDLPQ